LLVRELFKSAGDGAPPVRSGTVERQLIEAERIASTAAAAFRRPTSFEAGWLRLPSPKPSPHQYAIKRLFGLGPFPKFAAAHH
jgi:fibronectin type 3 domain-containing protein